MLIHRYSLQPDDGSQYVSLIAEAVENGSFQRIDVAIAYATPGGVREILPILRAVEDRRLRWLVGIDWCRSHPQALLQLSELPASDVRIHDGEYVVTRRACTPRISYHPKTWILRGADELAVIVGSGNLSGNGLTKGYEHGSLLMVRHPSSQAETLISDSMRPVCDWFDSAWSRSTPYSSIRSDYEGQFRSVISVPTPTDDDSTDVNESGQGSVDLLRVRQLRVATNLWIESGTLSRNRGPDRPGNQLDMSAMTRVFFEFPASAVPPNTVLGAVNIRYLNNVYPVNMRFGNNHMDKLNLPIPEEEGPSSYDGSGLLFQRRLEGSQSVFNLVVLRGGVDGNWLSSSRAAETSFAMTSGRRWGVF